MSACDLPVVDAACALGEMLADPGAPLEDAAASGFRAVAESMMNGFGRLLEWSMSWWVRLPSPDLTQMSALQSVRDHTTDLQVLMMTGAVMFTAARLALARRGALAGEVQESFLTFARAVYASWMFAAVMTAATRSGDAFSDWVITDASRGQATAALSRMLDASVFGPLGTAGMFILCLVGFLGALVQLVLLVVRQALLIVVVGAIPVAAAAAGTGPGSQAYKKLIAWSIAFALFKPVGATVYLIAFDAAGTGDDGDQQRLLGLILLALVGLVLPALMRMIAPAVSTMGSGGGGTAAAAMLGTGVGVAAAAGHKSVGAGSSAIGTAAAASSAGDSSSGSASPGGRVMTAGIGAGDSSADAGAPTGARTAAMVAGAAAGPASVAMAAHAAGGSAAQRVAAHVNGETDAGSDKTGRTLGQHEVRR